MPLDILLLLALPASGKSEVRRYLASVSDEVAMRDFGLGPTVQVDDYPYVHLMRRISEEQRRLGVEPSFFASSESPFVHPEDWLTLINLVNGDVAGLGRQMDHSPFPDRMLSIVEDARERAGVPEPTIDGGSDLHEAIAADTADLAADLPTPEPAELETSTIVIEFARGGPDGAEAPLPHPLGYQHSLGALDPSILDRASVLYVWVEPEESRRRNRERAVPGREGDASILHHGVPEQVMLHDYGMDDMAWLEARSTVPGTIQVEARGRTFHLPFARFDNREDRTSFLRGPEETWPQDKVERLHEDLSRALLGLAL